MSHESLPKFKYHPNPIATGSVERSDVKCVCCGQARGFVYTGPVYSVENYEDCICPWCIADGSAHEKLEASFHDESGVGGGGEWDEVPGEVVEEVAWRTPGGIIRICGGRLPRDPGRNTPGRRREFESAREDRNVLHSRIRWQT